MSAGDMQVQQDACLRQWRHLLLPQHNAINLAAEMRPHDDAHHIQDL